MINRYIEQAEEQLQLLYREIEEIAYFNQNKVLEAFQKNHIALRHFSGSSGYGYGDEGREKLNMLYASVFKAESAIVSPHIVSGTHALTIALFGLLKTGDKLLSITGMPYDTLQEVIQGNNNGSLKDYHIDFEKVELIDGKFDYANIRKALQDKKIQVIFIQRSRGYTWRDSLSQQEIKECIQYMRKLGFRGCILVDNCYGEFVEQTEPIENGADLAVGSCIKNIGGGLAESGGYIVGKRQYIDKVACRLTAPSIAGEVGSYIAGYRLFYQGLFLAPHIVMQTIKGSLLIGTCMQNLGYTTSPSVNKLPYDITRAIAFHTEEELIAFIQTVGEASPIDSFLKLEPWDMPGYDSKVIMAAGSFVQGASIELSADAPIRKPYIAYFQGGLTYEHCKCATHQILQKLLEKKYNVDSK